MKIVFARRGFSSSGGAESYLSRLVQGLQTQNIESTLLTDGTWPEDQWPGNHRIVLPSNSPTSFSQAVSEEKQKHPGAILFSFERIPCADVFRAGDGIHTAYLRRLALEGPFISAWLRSIRRHHRETRALEKRLFTENKNLHVICNSRMVADELQRLYQFPKERLSIIYNGFTPKPWRDPERQACRDRVRADLGIPTNAPVVLFVGSGWKRKGASVLADAFKNLQNTEAHLVLVGKGRLKTSLNPRVHLTGPVPNPRDYYLAADLFALPTLYDPFSNACLEASAYGLPVLTTDANGFGEALERFPGTGEVIPNPRIPESWAQAIDAWLGRPAERTSLNALIEAHSLEKNVSQTVEFLSRLGQG